jgi:hypothetical protein
MLKKLYDALGGRTHVIVLLCLGAAVWAQFKSPATTAASLPMFYGLLAVLSGVQGYRSTQADNLAAKTNGLQPPLVPPPLQPTQIVQPFATGAGGTAGPPGGGK